MTKPDLVVITTTWYNDSENDRIRASLSSEAFKQLSVRGYPTVVIDGGSSPEVLESFRYSGVEIYAEETRGMGKGRRQAIRKALEKNPGAILWMEPEKTDYVRSIEESVAPIFRQGEKADFVMPARRNLNGYPEFQQMTETIGAKVFNDTCGTKGFDPFFGPRAWRAGQSSYFLDYKSRFGDTWDSLHFPIIHAIYDKKKVEKVVVDFNYPVEQRQIEEALAVEFMEKRLVQLANLSVPTIHFWNSLSGKKS